MSFLNSGHNSPEQFYQRIYNYCKYHLYNDPEAAEDCTQDVFRTYYETIQTEKITQTKAWLYHTADNYIRRYVKKLVVEKKKLRSLEDLQNDLTEKDQPGIDFNFDLPFDPKINIQACAGKIIETLKPDEQELYRKYYVEHFHIKELSAMYKVSEGTMRVRIHRIREHIIDIIEQYKRGK